MEGSLDNKKLNNRGELKQVDPDKMGLSENIKEIPIQYTYITIDDDYLQKNSIQGGGLRMKGGHANWDGTVELIKYSISESLSPEHQKFVQDKIEKLHAGQEKTYQHEAHHIRNREHGFTPHIAATNLREFLSFRVLDELSAFSIGELYNQEITSENILTAIKSSQKKIIDSYYGQPFINEAKWYVNHHKEKQDIFSRSINIETYHAILRQYFNFNQIDMLNILNQSGDMSEFTIIINDLIMRLDLILEQVRTL